MPFFELTDGPHRAALWLMTGTVNDVDYQNYVDAIGRFDHVLDGRDGAVVQIVDPGVPAPPSVWRQRMADASSRLRSKPVFALVSTSPIIRGVLTAINWLRPPSYPYKVAATPQEAFAWAEMKLRRPVPFAQLLVEIRQRANTGASVASAASP